MIDERLARRVGAVTLIALAALSAAFVFLLDRVSLGRTITIRVGFRNIGNLHVRAPLVVGGQPIGRVEAIVPVPHGATGPLGGEVGVEARVAIARDAAWKVPADAEIFVSSRGPLSDRYLEVAPPSGPPGASVRDGQALRGVDPPSLDNVLQRSWTNMLTFQAFTAAVRPEVAALRAQLAMLRGELAEIDGDAGRAGQLYAEARGFAEAATQLRNRALGGDDGMAALRATLDDAAAAVRELRATRDAVAPRATLLADDLSRIATITTGAAARTRRIVADVQHALDQLAPLLANLAQLGDRLARGEGSLGRLMSDPEFSDDAKDLGKIIKRHPWRVLEKPPPD